MKRPTVRIYTEPNVYIDREMNDDELAQMEIDAANEAIKKAEAEAKAAAKAAAQAKLAALGLTISDLEALGL